MFALSRGNIAYFIIIINGLGELQINGHTIFS